MKSKAAYAVVGSVECMKLFFSGKKSQRRKLSEFFDTLASHPLRKGNWTELDDEGRTNQVAVAGSFVITYWADHAAREVRVVNIEKLD